MTGRLRLASWATDLDPDAGQARQWVLDELAGPDYGDTRPFWERFVQWVTDLFMSLMPNTDGPQALQIPPVVLALLIAAALAGVGWLLSRLRRERKAAAGDDQDKRVLGELDLSATEFRDRGLAAIRDGRWGDAVVEFTRAIARDAADRTLLVDAPSLTAHEIAGQLAPVFPTHGPDIDSATNLFDAVRYGRYAATESDAGHVRDLAATLHTAKPDLAGRDAPLAPAWGVPQ